MRPIDEELEAVLRELATSTHPMLLREEMKRLLERGADATITTSDDQLTALHFAAHSGCPEAMKTLLASAAGVHVNARDRGGETPLHVASRTGSWYDSADVVELLLAHGADACALTNLKKKPLDVALEWETDSGSDERKVRRRIVKLLREAESWGQKKKSLQGLRDGDSMEWARVLAPEKSFPLAPALRNILAGAAPLDDDCIDMIESFLALPPVKVLFIAIGDVKDIYETLFSELGDSPQCLAHANLALEPNPWARRQSRKTLVLRTSVGPLAFEVVDVTFDYFPRPKLHNNLSWWLVDSLNAEEADGTLIVFDTDNHFGTAGQAYKHMETCLDVTSTVLAGLMDVSTEDLRQTVRGRVQDFEVGQGATFYPLAEGFRALGFFSALLRLAQNALGLAEPLVLLREGEASVPGRPGLPPSDWAAEHSRREADLDERWEQLEDDALRLARELEEENDHVVEERRAELENGWCDEVDVKRTWALGIAFQDAGIASRHSALRQEEVLEDKYRVALGGLGWTEREVAAFLSVA